MRIITVVSLIVALALAVPAALAQTPAATGAERHYYITPYEMLDVYGAYPLSNGETLRITREGRRYFADMRSFGKVEIVAVDSIVFVSKDRSVKLKFTPRAFATDVVLDYKGQQGLAGSRS